MFYPVYVHKDPDSAYGLTFPDFPGCFSAADDPKDIHRMAQEAVEAHFIGDDTRVPVPSSPDVWLRHPDFNGGFWMMVDIDLTRVSKRAIRLNISLPESLVQRIDVVARDRHLSRSAFLALAAEKEMARQAA